MKSLMKMPSPQYTSCHLSLVLHKTEAKYRLNSRVVRADSAGQVQRNCINFLVSEKSAFQRSNTSHFAAFLYIKDIFSHFRFIFLIKEMT